MEGTIVRIIRDRGFCFILDDTGRDVLAHTSEFVERGSIVDLTGARVEFTRIESPKGWQAQAVRILDSDKGREHGSIYSAKPDFGFIDSDVGQRVFYHKTAIAGDWKPEPGIRVTFTTGIQSDGRTRALAVRQES